MRNGLNRREAHSMKQQLRIMLSPEALKRVSLTAQKSGLTVSQIIEDAIMRNSYKQADIARNTDYKRQKKEFMNQLEQAKSQISNEDMREHLLKSLKELNS